MRYLLTIVLTVISLYAFEMEEDFHDALKKAKVKERPLMAYLYMQNCRTCAYMDREVFSDPNVLKYLDTHYVVVHLYTDDASLPENLKVEMSPVFHFINAQNGKMIESIMGGRDAKRFLKLLKKSYQEYLDANQAL